MPVLEVKNLRKHFNGASGGSVAAIDGISLTVLKNEFVSVIGDSGGGKSTLLDCISGLLIPDSGEIIIDGRSVTGETGRVAYMMQDDVLLPWYTLMQNLILPFEIKGSKTKIHDRNIRNLASKFGLGKFLEFYPGELSGGMKQRASLLRTYLQDKSVMLLDEPFGRLDALLKIKLESWFLGIWQEKMLSVLFVTHDIDEAILLSDRILILSEGKIKKGFKIPFKRPRDSSILSSLEFVRLKSRLLRYFRLSA